MRGPKSNLKSRIFARIDAADTHAAWTPIDFLDLGGRDAVDKTLQRMAADGSLRRIDRGLYDKPRLNGLTGKPAVPDYRAVIDALARRDKTPMLVDGMTAANDLGLSDAVPGRVVVHTGARIRPISLGKLRIDFRLTAPSKLYWAGRPAMRVVQALHWLKPALSNPGDTKRIKHRLSSLISDSKQGAKLRADLADGLPMLPQWMHPLIRDVAGLPPTGTVVPNVDKRRKKNT